MHQSVSLTAIVPIDVSALQRIKRCILNSWNNWRFPAFNSTQQRHGSTAALRCNSFNKRYHLKRLFVTRRCLTALYHTWLQLEREFLLPKEMISIANVVNSPVIQLTLKLAVWKSFFTNLRFSNPLWLAIQKSNFVFDCPVYPNQCQYPQVT